MSDVLSHWLLITGDYWRNGWIAIRNAIRTFFQIRVDYVRLDLRGDLSELPPEMPLWRRIVLAVRNPAGLPPSLLELRELFDNSIADPSVRGVLLRLDGLQVGWARAQSLRDELERLRSAGKHVVVYLRECTPATYFVATGADEIYAPPSASWLLLGMHSQVFFLRDSLARLGISVDVIAVSPYKGAGDMFARSEMSKEQRDMLNWILDGLYARMIDAIADGRKQTSKKVRAFIDRGLVPIEDAVTAGLLDGLCYEDELPSRLGADKPADLKIVTSAQAALRLMERPKWRTGKYVGLVALQGPIMTGRSRRLPGPSPLGQDRRAGCDTVIADLQAARDNDKIASVVFYVDSPGGDAAASDWIWREVSLLAAKKPVVVCMGDVAASGGYYVAAAGQRIIASSATLTGSIGVIAMKASVSGLLDKMEIGRESLSRGKHAGLFSQAEPLDKTQLKQLHGYVAHTYDRFLQVVADGRKLTTKQLEPVADGRVWLGAQALDHGLIDEIGDLRSAIAAARDYCEADPARWTPVLMVEGDPDKISMPDPDADNQVWAQFLAPLKMLQQLQLRPLLLLPLGLKPADR